MKPRVKPQVSSTTFTTGTRQLDRKSTRLNSSHDQISYAVFCLKKKRKRSVESRTILISAIWLAFCSAVVSCCACAACEWLSCATTSNGQTLVTARAPITENRHCAASLITFLRIRVPLIDLVSFEVLCSFPLLLLLAASSASTFW